MRAAALRVALLCSLAATGTVLAQAPSPAAPAAGQGYAAPPAERVASDPADAVVYAKPAVDTIATVRRRGVLRVGMATAMPWVMHDKDGTLVGFSVDLATRLADDLGVRLEIVETSWSSMVPDLLDGHFDVVASGLWITPARALQINYSEPTSMSAVHLLGARTQAATLKAAADFDKAGVTLAVNEGTGMEQVAALRFPKATLLKVAPEDDAVAQVLAGKAQGAVVMTPVPNVLVNASGGALYMPTGSALQQSPAALAVRKGDPDFLNFLNAWLTFQRSDGWLASRFAYWFESTDWLSLL